MILIDAIVLHFKPPDCLVHSVWTNWGTFFLDILFNRVYNHGN